MSRKIKVLCVEDEQDICENIADILRDEDYEVFTAQNGKEGFESFIANSPDIIISDIMMPEVNGYAFLKMVRESKNTRNNTVPFIFLSALGQKDNIIKGVNYSANDYLIKPIDFDLMLAKIKEKTANAIKVQEVNDKKINNLKSQVGSVLPTEILSYLDVISQISDNLKQEPYGPFPHSRYLDDISKINIYAMKLVGSINNALDSSVIDSKLNANEEVTSIHNILEEFVSGISSKFSSRIKLPQRDDQHDLAQVKIDILIFKEALRKILAGMLKSDANASVKLSIIMDPSDQMVIIFSLMSDQKVDLHLNINESNVSKILDEQNCRFEIVEHKDNKAVLAIPSYRVLLQK